MPVPRPAIMGSAQKRHDIRGRADQGGTVGIALPEDQGGFPTLPEVGGYRRLSFTADLCLYHAGKVKRDRKRSSSLPLVATETSPGDTGKMRDWPQKAQKETPRRRKARGVSSSGIVCLVIASPALPGVAIQLDGLLCRPLRGLLAMTNCTTTVSTGPLTLSTGNTYQPV